MNDLINWLSHNAAASTVLICAFGVLVLTVTTLYAFAFFQGRAISFWPPKIGPLPSAVRGQRTPTPDSSETRPVEVPDALALRPGAVLISAKQDKLTIKRRIYSGGTATIFEAASAAHGKVSVKLFWQGLNPESTEWDLFQTEVRAAEVLSHRNILRVFDRGLAGGYPFIVLEYMDGGTLREFLKSHDRVPGPAILSIATQLADAIDYAHSQGVIHRDLKPDNVLFESDVNGRIAVSDFGIARILGAAMKRITADFDVVGTLDYIAPEVIGGGAVTAAADIYAFGVILFEMIAGRKPFHDMADTASLIASKMNDEARKLSEFRRAPDDLVCRIALVLSRDSQRRPKSARAAITGLEDVITQL